MPSEAFIMDIRRAQAEAAIRMVRDWKPADDIAARARRVEELAREGLDSPRRLRELVNDVLDKVPNDGSMLEYLNRQHATLTACFAVTIDALRTTRDLARESEAAGCPVPSLPELEKAIGKAEQVRSDTLAHWELFEPHPQIDAADEWISHEDFLKMLESQMSPEARRELQARVERESR
jgi:hypothetical protein